MSLAPRRTTTADARTAALGRRARRACVTGAAVVAALLAAGCGSGRHASANGSEEAGAHSNDASAQRSLERRQQALHEQVVAALHHPSTARYGGLPAYLPKPKVPAHRMLTATPRHAVLTVEGDTVEVELPGARGRATVVGPDVPDKDQGTFQDTARVSFDVTFAAVRGSLPLARSAFTVTDELGAIHHPRLSARHGGRAPAIAPRGTPITIRLRTTLPIGNGRVQYRPVGRRALASWDFDSETD